MSEAAAKVGSKEKRVDIRKSFSKSGLVIFNEAPQTTMETLNISVSGVSIVSPIHPQIKSICWVRLKIPVTPEKDQTFDVKATVSHSIFCNAKGGFQVGLLFSNPPAAMVKLINQIK